MFSLIPSLHILTLFTLALIPCIPELLAAPDAFNENMNNVSL